VGENVIKVRMDAMQLETPNELVADMDAKNKARITLFL